MLRLDLSLIRLAGQLCHDGGQPFTSNLEAQETPHPRAGETFWGARWIIYGGRVPSKHDADLMRSLTPSGLYVATEAGSGTQFKRQVLRCLFSLRALMRGL
jgi:hypothetical protein